MFRQAIIASVPRGLDPARSGYCQVAGHTELPQSLLTQLEAEVSIHATRVEALRYEQSIQVGTETWEVVGIIQGNIRDYSGRTTATGHFLLAPRTDLIASYRPQWVFEHFHAWKLDWADSPQAYEPRDLWMPPREPADPAMPDTSRDPKHSFRLGETPPPAIKLQRTEAPRTKKRRRNPANPARTASLFLAVMLAGFLLYLFLR